LNWTKQFSICIISLVESMPETRTARIIGNQLIRSGTSVGANYRAANRAKSCRDFINKLKIVEEELDETLYWFDLLEESKIISLSDLKALKNEANELLAIFISAIKTTRKNILANKNS